MSDTTDQLRERLQQLLDLIGQEEVQVIIEVATEEIPKKLTSIEQALESGELEQVSRLAHGLKGDTGTLGMDTMAEIAKQLEGVQEPTFAHDAKDLLAQLNQSYERQLPVLKEFA